LLDDFTLLQSAFELNNQSPLGSAAGYGALLPISKELVAKLLGFSKIQENYLYCQNSRGKVELAIVHALQQVILTINKFSNDLLTFTMSEFGYFYLPDNFLTGSSIMVQKKNYDVVELLRSKYAAVSSDYFHLNSLISNLPSGYNRDFQEIKKPLFSSFDIATKTITITNKVISNLMVHKDKLKLSIKPDLLVTNEVYKEVEKGVPFKQAYKLIGNKYQQGKLPTNPEYNLPSFSYDFFKNKIDANEKIVNEKKTGFNKCLSKLTV
jgi:argininosuccinate lyase